MCVLVVACCQQGELSRRERNLLNAIVVEIVEIRTRQMSRRAANRGMATGKVQGRPREGWYMLVLIHSPFFLSKSQNRDQRCRSCKFASVIQHTALQRTPNQFQKKQQLAVWQASPQLKKQVQAVSEASPSSQIKLLRSAHFHRTTTLNSPTQHGFHHR